MSEQEQQESQKTVVAFVAGLLIGGLLVWIFSGTPADSPAHEDSTDTDSEMTDHTSDDSNTKDSSDSMKSDTASDTAPEMVVGDGKIGVSDQTAGRSVTIDSATFPTEDGWIAVRSYSDGALGNILGAARYSKSQGLIPESVELLAPTVTGRQYAVVFFTENGDRKFDLATDSQIEGTFETFTAE
ncbi:hypothetical protein H6783_02950 [Candidatus Nomurabacteria bacterium]|nr:hypothetical protein [Candidatus Nomurabacteria bacterium]